MQRAISVASLIGFLAVLVGLFIYATDRLPPAYSLTIMGGGGIILIAVGLLRFEQVKMALGARSTRYGTNAVVMIIFFLAILSILNVLAGRYARRTDLTANKRFSLSDLSIQVVKGLDRDIQITAFYREGQGQEMRDLLEEYHNQSVRVKVRFVDPDREPAQAQAYEITSYGTVVVEAGDKRESILGRREEDLTNAILKVSREGKKVIYFLQGHGERDLEESKEGGYRVAREALKKLNYEVKPLVLLQQPEVPKDCVVLVVAGPKKDLLSNEIEAIRTYLEQGGKGLFMLDPNFPERTADLSQLMAEWGATLGDDMVVDVSGVGRLFGMGPSVPAAAGYESHPITRGLPATFFPLARSVGAAGTSEAGLQVRELVKTSKRSWAESRPAEQVSFDEGQDSRGPVSVAVVVTAALRDSSALIQSASPGDPVDLGKKQEKKTRLVVIGDSDFATNNYFAMVGNGDLFTSAISWLAEEEDLVAIGPKERDTRLVQLSATQVSTIFYITVIFLPAVVLLAGVTVWWRRR